MRLRGISCWSGRAVCTALSALACAAVAMAGSSSKIDAMRGASTPGVEAGFHGTRAAALGPGVVVVDFTVDDNGVAIADGQILNTPPGTGADEFFQRFTITTLPLAATPAIGDHIGPCIFDTDPAGPNSVPPPGESKPIDDDLLVDIGNILILQDPRTPDITVADIYDLPNDDPNGGTVIWDFVGPVRLLSVDLADVDLNSQNVGITRVLVRLFDSDDDMREYDVPDAWTFDVSAPESPDDAMGWMTLDLTTLANQPGEDRAPDPTPEATASQDAGFDPNDVRRLEIEYIGSGGFTNVAFGELGACCIPGTGCEQLTEEECTNMSGTFEGDFTECAAVECPGPCCIPGELCTETLTESECEAANGTFFGDDETCASIGGCPGACCLPDTGCNTALGENDCIDQGGEFLGADTTCVPDPCPGACCIPGMVCTETTPSACEAANGTFAGSGTDCGVVECPGACCIPGQTCNDGLTETACSALSGEFFGEGSTCADIGGCPGACCFAGPKGRCENLLESDCGNMGGVFLGQGTLCEVGICPGACCVVGQACQEQTEAACDALGGDFQGEFTTCAGIGDCPGACCIPGVGCIEVRPAECEGIFGGVGTRCATFSCPGACCISESECINLTEMQCSDAGGAFSGPNDTCEVVGGCPGACCLESMPCVQLTESECIGGGGIFAGENISCDSFDCPGACCVPGQVCQELLEDTCIEIEDAVFLGEGVSCAEASCPGACCLEDGTCVDFQTAGECDSLGGLYLGDNTVCSGSSCPDGCPPDLIWTNFELDNRTGVISGINILNTPDAEAADDCWLVKGFIYRVDSVCGIMITNDVPSESNPWEEPDAELRIYSDCDGQPDELLETLTNPDWEILGPAPFGGGQWFYVRFCFDLNKRMVDGGVRTWYALVGVGDEEPGEQYYWASCNDGEIQGRQANLRAPGIFGDDDWHPIEDSPNGPCTDLCLDVFGEKCVCICDNTPFDDDCGAKILNSTTFGSKSADNFQVASCKATQICKIEAWVATNCDITNTRLEIYENDCDEPSADPPLTFTEPWIFLTGEFYTSPVTGVVMPIYRVCFEFEPGELFLAGGQNYWLSVFVPGSGFISDEAYFLCKEDGDCEIKISQAKHIADLFGVKIWEDISQVLPGNQERDLAFRVIGTDIQTGGVFATAPEPAAPQAPAGPDVTGDGVIDADDVMKVLEELGR